MKSKLKIFTDFAEGVLPHEASYLQKENRIRDREKSEILERVCRNAERFFTSEEFDEEIDKRKYAYIKKWIGQKLERADVDAHLEYLSHIEKQILTDTISSSEEKELLEYIHIYDQTSFYFQKFYELVREYQDYLLVRFRYQDCEITEAFLKENQKYYQKALKVKDEIFHATKDLTRQYTSQNTNTKPWESRLLEYLYDDELDGRNKYHAFIRLVFLYFNYKEYEKARQVFDYIDECFKNGLMYSRRVLFNYYANRVILHSNLKDLDQAEYYAHLSVKQENSDQLFYLNNLVAILLKKEKNKEALDLLTGNYKLFKNSFNHHQKLGFATHYVRTLVRNKRIAIAETFARNFLYENRKHVFEHRWSRFFSNYLMLLTTAEKPAEVIGLTKKYNLLERETEAMCRDNFIPKIHWYYHLANYLNGQSSEDRLFEQLTGSIDLAQLDAEGTEALLEFIDRLAFSLPRFFSRLKSHFEQNALIY
ncbi:hypothetical protein GCM10023115_29850 [Pontixanthobacter gangjinensis]|uniref:Tetratricopeptide repeat protein n=1 Tax=Christiangramia aestuarii TaxID=1028746 RepID=A0A7K1LN56_9FLAO|nr:hypothetical protein [Christiangramia aestuarii]MUP42217.1 hypothetical protein [Christiangramia aestuarii]